MCSTDLSLLELRLEAIKSLDNTAYEPLKCLCDGGSISEDYLKRENILRAYGLFGKKVLCTIYLRADNKRAIDNGKSSMFVGIGDISELSRPLASVEWLQPLDSRAVFRADSSEVFASPLGFDRGDSVVELLGRVLNWKLRSLYLLPRIEAGQLIDEIIESGAKVVDDFTNKNAESLRYGNRTASDIPDIDELTPFDGAPNTSVINGHAICLVLAEEVNPSFELIEMLACPIDALISAIQRLHTLY